MIYSTLKANKEHGITYWQIIEFYDMGIGCAGRLFGDKYVEDDEWTKDALFEDFTERQIASACLKAMKADDDFIVHNKMLLDLDIPEIIYSDLEDLIKAGELTSARELREIDRKTRKKGCRVQKEERYGENGIYCRFLGIEDLIDKYLPCNVELYDSECNNCGHCH